MTLLIHQQHINAQARAGDGVDVTVSGVEPQSLRVGSVLCSPGWLVPQVTAFEARVVVLQPPIPILHGQQVRHMPLQALSPLVYPWQVARWAMQRLAVDVCVHMLLGGHIPGANAVQIPASYHHHVHNLPPASKWRHQTTYRSGDCPRTLCKRGGLYFSPRGAAGPRLW